MTPDTRIIRPEFAATDDPFPPTMMVAAVYRITENSAKHREGAFHSVEAAIQAYPDATTEEIEQIAEGVSR